MSYEEVQVDDTQIPLRSLLESQKRMIEKLDSFNSTLLEENERLRSELRNVSFSPQNGSGSDKELTYQPSGMKLPSAIRAELEAKLREKHLENLKK